MASYPCAQTIGRGAGIGETQQAAYAPHQRRQTPLGNGRRTTWKRRACRRRAGHHDAAPSWLPRSWHDAVDESLRRSFLRRTVTLAAFTP